MTAKRKARTRTVTEKERRLAKLPSAVYYGNAGHFICAQWCRFHLTTKVGQWLVSTVGQLWPERSTREIYARVRDAAWLEANSHLKGDYFDAAYAKRFGYETLGCDRTYETMVFRAGKPCASKDCNCGLPEIDGSELDFAGYNDAGSATRGHRKMVAKWQKVRRLARGAR